MAKYLITISAHSAAMGTGNFRKTFVHECAAFTAEEWEKAKKKVRLTSKQTIVLEYMVKLDD